MTNPLPARTGFIASLLDRAHPPVALFRIMSTGLAPNHMLKVSEDISGTAACLACGNCVDACPVVESKPAGVMFVRTSMLLENVVADECRRCYRCIAACPQVHPAFKEYARNFRRVERAVHWDLLTFYLSLMTTGLLIFHWGGMLPRAWRSALGVVHRVSAVGFLAAPVLYFLLDRRHFLMTFQKALSWSRGDWSWFRNTGRWLLTFGKEGALKRGAYNPAQRLWYLYAAAAILTFAVTGSAQWLGAGIVGKGIFDAATSVHVVAAYSTDLLLALHVYLKLVWPALRRIARGVRVFFAYRRRERLAGPL